MKLFLSASLLIFVPLAISAQIFVAQSYSFLTGPSGIYPDSPFGQLSDGTKDVLTWGGGNTISFSDIGPFVGWQFSDPLVRFEFGTSPVQIETVTAWLSDSNGAAGVALPLSARITTDGGFSKTFTVTDPAGSGAMLPISFGGLGLNTDHLILSLENAGNWTMLTEVEFSAVPEPSSLGGYTSLLILGLVASRRRK